jgi:stringent starvation protein B
MSEISTKPYLLRAIHDWCTDSGYTPYLAVRVDERVRVPLEFVKNGEIVLNVSTMATSRLNLGNDAIEFNARFGGVAREVYVPISNVLAIYARENGQGMAFEAQAEGEGAQPESAPTPASAGPVLSLAPAPAPEQQADAADSPPPEPPPRGGRPHLQRIK